MRKFLLLLITIVFISSSCERDKPELFNFDAKLKIENTSSSNYITGVYFGTVGPGTTNKISSNIGPGESKTFTIDTSDDDIYDIRITSDMPGDEEFTIDHYDFGWDETYIIELTDNGWYTDTSW